MHRHFMESGNGAGGTTENDQAICFLARQPANPSHPADVTRH
jgi:hypothetical protein